MKPIYLQLFSICFVLIFFSCKKEAGDGGTSSIKGKVHAKYYDKDFYSLASTSYAPDIDVFIIYGDESVFGERQRTTYDGTYEFKYLRKGKYRIYAYSRDSTGFYKNQVNKYSPEVPIIKNVEITKGKQFVEVSDIHVLK